MVKESRLPRLAQTIMEPGDFEKNILRNLMQDIRNLISSKQQLGSDIQKFAADVGEDFFSPLIASSYEGVRLIGYRQLTLAARLAHDLIYSVFNGLVIYLDESSALKPLERKRIVMEFMATKQSFGGELASFEKASEEYKSKFHLEQISKLLRTLTISKMTAVVIGVDAKQMPGDNNYKEIAGQFEESGHLRYPLTDHPTMIGIYYADLSLQEAIAKQHLILDGYKNVELKKVLDLTRESLKAHFSRSVFSSDLARTPSHYSPIESASARDTLTAH